MHGTNGTSAEQRRRAAREKAYATPLSEFHPGNPELFRSDTLWPYFERLRNEEPVHFCSTSPVGNYWSVTKYNDIMHVDTNAAIFSSDINLGGIMLRDVGAGIPVAELHRDGRAEARPAAQDRVADVHADPSRQAGGADPRAVGGGARSPAAQRDLQLGGPGLGRADDPDARHPVRFPVGRPPQADAMVRPRHRFAEEQALRERRAAARPSLPNAATTSRGCGTSASTPSRAAT